LATCFIFLALLIGYSNKNGVVLVMQSTGYGCAVVEATPL
jgi:hypothetical protein